MCGILGAVGIIPTPEKFKAALDMLAPRGPDDEGVYFDAPAGVMLGHRRLSIIDLSSAGHQPMVSNDGRYIIIFNGEIYNYLEIKEELRSRYEFKTKTDTEVLLAAYSVWGAECLQKCNGMFAFAIWDTIERRLFCARDRLGEKPFYYFQNGDRLVFASEIKALLRLGFPRRANERIIYDYLYYGFYDHTDETFFEGIRRLPAGHYAVWEAGKFSISKYWDVAERRPGILQSAPTREQIHEHFKELLADAIRLRFRSDVPVGLNLSSGVDSNSLWHYARQVTGSEINLFSMCTESEEYNECSLIDGYISDSQRARWHTALVQPGEIRGEAERMNMIQDEPYGGIPTMAYAKLIALAKDSKVTVLLEGQGVDEILGGYGYYRAEAEKDLAGIDNGGQLRYGYSQDMTREIDDTILAPEFVRQHRGQAAFRRPLRDQVRNAQYRDLVYTKLPRVLRFNDHVTMAFSRELRLPYLDHRLVEFCFWLPVEYKIAGTTQKVLLREVMEPLLPRTVSGKPKRAFGAVQTEWLRAYFKDWVYEHLTSESFKQRGYWNNAKLIEKADAFYAGRGDNSFFLWQCLNLEMWLRAFID